MSHPRPLGTSHEGISESNGLDSRAQDYEDGTTNGASSRLSNIATGGDTESPPPLPTATDMAGFPGAYNTGVLRQSSTRSRPLSQPNSTGLENGPLSHSAGSLPLDRRLHQVSSEMLGGGSGRPSTAGSHVPSLTSKAFLAPMSSQKLQQHRNQRPVSLEPFASQEDLPSNTQNRYSTGSAMTMRGGHALPTQYDTDTLPSESRATSRASDRSEWLEANDVDRDRDFREFMASQQSQRTGLGQTDDGNTASYSERAQKQYIPDEQPGPRQQQSFISRESAHNSFLGRPPNHLPLYSADVSPRRSQTERQKEAVKPYLGKNFEYFTGNTVFWGGGRFQNARDKPVVLGTALIIIFPAVLFFIFS